MSREQICPRRKFITRKRLQFYLFVRRLDNRKVKSYTQFLFNKFVFPKSNRLLFMVISFVLLVFLFCCCSCFCCHCDGAENFSLFLCIYVH